MCNGLQNTDMNKTDIIVWYRLYLPTGGSTDVQFRPLEFRSWRDFADDFQEKADAVGFVDYDVVDWEYLTQGEAYSINQKEDIWEKYSQLFDVAKDYAVPPAVITAAANDLGGYDDFQEFMENGYRGEYDSIKDYAYNLIDDIGLSDDLAENYFDYASFGRTLESEGFAYSMTMEDWEDRYDTELEAEAAYDEMSRLRPQELAEYYIYDVVGDLKSALTADVMKQYFDYDKFARDLEYDGYYEVRAGSDTYIFQSF